MGLNDRLKTPSFLPVSLLSMLLACVVVVIIEQHAISLNKSSAEVIASSFSSKIENSLHHGLSATYPLAALIRTQQGRMDGFSQLATEMLPNYPGVNSLQLQPNGIVTEIVPLAGNEAALDHNLLADPKRDKEAFEAKETRQLTLAGPFNLMQGGVGAVARLPVYLDTETGSEFWGFTAALLLFPDILEPANLSALTKAGLAYQLVKKHPDSGEYIQIAASETPLVGEPVSLPIALPNSHWELQVTPINGWIEPASIFTKLIIASTISLLVALLILYRYRLHQSKINQKQREKEQVLLRFQSRLLSLSQAHYIDYQEAIQQILKGAAQELGVERISMWYYINEKSAIECSLLIENGYVIPPGQILQYIDFPRYFEALEKTGFIAADNAHIHPATHEFSQPYLSELGITSMLDAPIRIDGKNIGIICYEHIGPMRHWTLEEGDFARSISDLCANRLLEKRRQEAEEKLYLMAHYDVLTNLPNRSLFVDRFKRAIAHSQRTQTKLAVCLLDLDNFKPINDNYGHDVGDKLLVEVAQRLTDCLRAEDTVSRFGGDEFSMLINDISSTADLEFTLKRILTAIAGDYDIDDKTLNVTSSIGITLFPDDQGDIDTLLRHADQAMYQAKLLGKNRHYFFNPKEDQTKIAKHNQLEQIKQALANNEFTLFYQPKVNMKTGTVMGVEGLVRWVHPDKGVLPPSHFLPIIQDSEVELDFGRTIIQLGLEQLTDWQQSRTPLALSINISPQHLLSPNFVSELQQSLLAFSTVKPASLEFEILETGALNDIEQMQNVVQLCQTNIGISIALDDFGTGYSSLAHLRYLTAQTIKIDRAFVRDLLVDPSDYAIVESIIALAKAFNRSVIAEGVETIEQGEKLLEMGCELAQGYVIAKPMPIDELMDWLNDYKPVDSWIHHNA